MKEKICKGLKIALSIIEWAFAIIFLLVGLSSFMSAITKNPKYNFIGINIYCVMTESMASVNSENDYLKDFHAGFINVDDAVIVKNLPKNYQVKVGDIVTFLDQNGTPIIHRVREVLTVNGVTYYITRGDANNADDPMITRQNITGIYLFKIPYIGGFMLFLKSPYGIIAILIVIFIWLYAKYLKEIEKEKLNPLYKQNNKIFK